MDRGLRYLVPGVPKYPHLSRTVDYFYGTRVCLTAHTGVLQPIHILDNPIVSLVKVLLVIGIHHLQLLCDCKSIVLRRVFCTDTQLSPIAPSTSR